MFVFLFLFFSMLLLCSFFRLKELFPMKNGLTKSLLFFSKTPKNLSRSDDAKRRKKRGWPNQQIGLFLVRNIQRGGITLCKALIKAKKLNNVSGTRRRLIMISSSICSFAQS